tara:strand:- start:41867 stop:42016 length:150 start_codon:yes stop_codon:yes gene_type:complete
MFEIKLTLTREEAVITQIALAIYSEQAIKPEPIMIIIDKFNIKFKKNYV